MSQYHIELGFQWLDAQLDSQVFLTSITTLIEEAITSSQLESAVTTREVAKLLRHSHKFTSQLNHRQIALLSHALKNPGYGYTVESHRHSHKVTQQTSRTDLLKLADLGLLEKAKVGRAFVFYAPEDLQKRII